MAEEENTRVRTSTEFIEETVLEAFVPSASRLDIQNLLENWDGEIPENSNSIVPFIEQRPFLLLDEIAEAYVVLRTRLLGEDTLQAYLGRLTITLDARAYGSSFPKSSEEKPAVINELLFAGAIQDSDPTICATEVQSEGESEPLQYLYVFWKTSVPLGRPKNKINKLSVYFTPSASLKPAAAVHREFADDEYLPCEIPQPINLLQPFANDPALGGLKPSLSAPGISRSAHVATVSKALLRPLRSGPRRLFRAAPAFLWRVRFTKSPASSEPNVTIASLDLEITSFAGSNVSINKMDLSISPGHAEPLGPRLPLTSQPGDQITLLYRLRPSGADSTSMIDQSYFLALNAAAGVLISSTCTPQIQIDWTTPVDLPSSRSNSRAGSSKPPSKPLGPDSLPIADQTSPSIASSVNANGVSFTISGPPKVEVGSVFKWNLFAVNRSDQVHRFAVLAMPKHRHMDRRHSTNELNPSFKMTTEANKDGIAEAVLDDNVICTLQRNAAQEPTELICLSPDVRIGPLAPAACFTTELKFVALASGVLYLDSLRVVDLNTQDTTDIRELPDIVAVEQEEN
ncbi:hypothetical protein E6O75_ATG05216 [Venturia nashicola]|uniref:Trafficking protein particle complex II-specific subunit 65 IgD3 domain-containing protein n=1 Tax=Venturia nashicola TaxID=86259 RepID=A0A4Z1PA70_9PEZI|nr:hypothetical protein E6O75_ATG05216 [Venturia nashicola]